MKKIDKKTRRSDYKSDNCKIMKREKRLICPACKKNVCAAGMRGHINGLARMEVYRWYLLRTQPNSVAIFGPTPKKEEMPHQKYIETHSTTKTITKIKI